MKKTFQAFSLALCIFLPVFAVSAYGDILDSWHWRNPAPFSDTVQSICFGDGKFVAVGSGGVIHTSSDGQLWDDGQRPVLFTLNKVIYANGQFVAVGNHGTIVISTNGFNWSQQVSGTTNDLLAVTFGKGIYVAAGTAGRLAISSDGISWSSASAGTEALNWITFGNGGVYVASYKPADCILWGYNSAGSSFSRRASLDDGTHTCPDILVKSALFVPS